MVGVSEPSTVAGLESQEAGAVLEAVSCEPGGPAGGQHGAVLLEALSCQRAHGLYCDVVLQTPRSQHPAHRNVLAAASPYLHTLLKQTAHSPLEYVQVDCKDEHVFKNFLDYIYTGNIVLDSTNVEELLLFSNRYVIANLRDYCCEFLERDLTILNCFKTKNLAQNCGLSSLSNTVDSFILANIADIVQQEEVLLFSEKRIQTFVSNKTVPLREEIKLHVIHRWTHQDVAGRQALFPRLLELLAWDQINTAQVLAMLNDDNLYKGSEWCLYSLLKVLLDRGVLSSPYKIILKELEDKFSCNDTEEREELVPDIGLCTAQSPVKEEALYSSLTSSDSLSQSILDQEMRVCWDDDQVNADNSVTISDDSQTASQLFEVDSSFPTEVDGDGFDSMSDKVKKNKGKNKRKGIPIKINPKPIKVRIAKSSEKSSCKRRGRPPKNGYKVFLQASDYPDKAALDMSNDDEPNDDDYKSSEDSEAADETLVLSKDKKCAKRVKGKRGRKPKSLKNDIKCDDCQFVCSSPQKLVKHKNQAHKTNTSYSCPICEYESTWNREYYNHVKTHFAGPPFVCDYSCGYSAERIQHLLYHRMTHTDERPFNCTVCSMSFRSKNNLAMHAKCHTGAKPFKCHVCERSFATKGTLDQHSVTHSDLRPYLCDLCGFSTKYQSHLISHKRIHTGDVFKCQYPKCEYSTPKRSQLACHMRTHLSIRAHVCSVCGRAFVERSHLVRHEKIHLADKPYKCEQCDYESTRRDKLKDHVAKYHSSQPAPPATYKPRRTRRQTYQPSAFPCVDDAPGSPDPATLDLTEPPTLPGPPTLLLDTTLDQTTVVVLGAGHAGSGSPPTLHTVPLLDAGSPGPPTSPTSSQLSSIHNLINIF